MEVRVEELDEHRTSLNSLLVEVSGAPDGTTLIRRNDLCLSTCGTEPYARSVVSDLDVVEFAVRLPVPSATQPRFWLALHECWRSASRRRVTFSDCGVRLYTGLDQSPPIQIMRLEWVAPVSSSEGGYIYQGAHAGHPHWHVDKDAFLSVKALYESLEALTAPPTEVSEVPTEEFSLENVSSPSEQSTPPYLDCSWMSAIHLPANAQWATVRWDGTTTPGPHQQKPESLNQVENWWEGSLRYIRAELRQTTS